jgi:hypothetical protein
MNYTFLPKEKRRKHRDAGYGPFSGFANKCTNMFFFYPGKSPIYSKVHFHHYPLLLG